ncbi:MAG: tripartite tricarboxylate transporter substrate binding protein [Usitatibacteraceae bacterium]
MKKYGLVRSLLAFVCSFAALSTPAQEFPTKSITMVVGFAAGGAADTAARIIARKLGENLGLSVVVDNRAGAGGNIAHQQIANATPDGSIILLGSVGPLCIAPHLIAKLGYDPQRDLAPLTMGLSFPNVLVVHAGVPAKNFQEFLALAKAKPGALDYASTGVASASHLAGEMFKQRAGVDILHVPYKGGGPAMIDLLAGRITAYYSTYSTAGPHIDTGKLRPLAVTGLERLPVLPNVPTIAESGFPGFDASNWYAFVAPGKTPKNILDRWNTELVKVLRDPAVREQLDKHGLTPKPGTREELASTIVKESAVWAKVIKDGKITAE